VCNGINLVVTVIFAVIAVETPDYLFSKGKLQEMERSFRKIASFNNREQYLMTRLVSEIRRLLY